MCGPQILKFSVLVLDEIEVGHPWSTVYNLKKKLKRRVTDTRLTQESTKWRRAFYCLRLKLSHNKIRIKNTSDITQITVKMHDN
jgi:hypothetical protein